MSSTVLCAVILLACALTLSAAQTSCRGRCGAEYYRGYTCQCDYTCLSYGECCQDFESQCTTKDSCKGRCGEAFKRGRLCSCDSDCVKFKQCCSDYQLHCDAEVIATEEISGAASATAPVKTSSCDNVKDNKPKELEPSTFNEGNNADDDFIPPVSPTSYPPDDPSDDMYNQILPNEELSNNGAEDPEAVLVPEGTSGYDSSTADLLDQVPTEPTLGPDAVEFSTEAPPSDNEPTQADDSPATTHMSSGEAPTESSDASDPPNATDAGTTLPQPTTAADHVSSEPTTASAPQTGVPPTASAPELRPTGQATVQPVDDIIPEAQKTDPTDEPDVTTPPLNPASVSAGVAQDDTVLEMSQATTTPASSTQDPTPIPDATTSNPAPDDTTEGATATPPSVLADLEDPSTTVSPVGELSEPEAVVTPSPSVAAPAQDDAKEDVTPEATTADPVKVTPEPTKPQPSEPTSKPVSKPDPYKPSPSKPTAAKPVSKPETKPLDTAQTLNVDDPRNYQGDDSNDTNLCSGRPVSAVTTLRNGTVVVFRGHYFWLLDGNRVPGPAQGITQVWGVPSPIDTVFTRCNCQGKTYIFRGSQYWRYENDVLDSGYPRVIQTGFDGLRGHVTAALSVPQYRSRRESVYFFKRGGLVQKYSYQFGTSPTCGKKVHTVHNRTARQAVSHLDPAVNIRVSWRGFPSTVTAAVSVPSSREPEGYKYYVFSRSKSYNVRMASERPVIAAPKANTPPQSNDVFKCPKKV